MFWSCYQTIQAHVNVGQRMAKTTRASKSMAQRIGARIRQIRKASGITQAELAERAGMDNMTISRLENGARAPSLDQLERLSTVFTVPISHFLNEEEHPASSRGREIASLLSSLDNDQQSFVIDLVRIYVETHGKKTRTSKNKK